MRRAAYKSILAALVFGGTLFSAGISNARAQMLPPILPPYPAGYVGPVAPVAPYYAPYYPRYYGWSGAYWGPGLYGRPWGGYARPFGPRYYRRFGPYVYGPRWY
jgi:hypothetical protein